MQHYFTMSSIKRGLLYTFILQFLFISVYSQYDNSFFDADKYDTTLDSSHIQFHFDNLNYFRNTEYTSKVDKGSTFVGFHLLPYMQYQFNEKASIYGGLFIRYDFGNPEIKTIEPYLKFKYRLWGHDLIFGNLEGTVQHQIIEPMVDYEWAVTDRTEHGIQIKRENTRIAYDFWIDWQRMIYEDDPFNEIFYGGLNLKYSPIMNEKTKFTLNGQGITVHKAGEIDKSVEPNAMEYNYAYGFEFSHQFNTNVALFLSAHNTQYYNLSSTAINGIKSGYGSLAVARLRLHEYDIVLNYWDGINFQSPIGDRLYYSVGRRNIGNRFEHRQMIGLRIANELHVAKNLVFLNRIGFNYNIDHDRFDVVMENYLRWHFRTKPKAVKIY